LGAWVPVTRAARLRERRRGALDRLLALHDATGVGGLLGALALLSLLGLAPEGDFVAGPVRVAHGLVPLALVFVAAHRGLLPRRPENRLAALERFARTLRHPGATGPALERVVHVAADGRWQDARLRLHPARAPEGLVRTDLVVAERPGPGGSRAEVALLVVTRTGSFADAVLDTTDAPSPRAALEATAGGRRPRLYAPGALTEVMAFLARHESAGRPRSRSELGRQRVEARPALEGRRRPGFGQGV
ncbi:MAG: hypothetical protein AAGH15_15925, partial [Myxococcota bacterium]